MDNESDEGLLVTILKDFGMGIPSASISEGFLKEFEIRLDDFDRLKSFLTITKVETLIKDETCFDLFRNIKKIDEETNNKIPLTKGDLGLWNSCGK